MLLVVAGLAVTAAVDRGLPELAWPSWLPWATTTEPGEAPVDPGDAAPDLLVPLVTLDDGGLRWMALLAVPGSERAATVLLVPASLIADVPGHGTLTLDEAATLGGSSLAAASLANLLGVRVDPDVAVTVTGWGALTDAAGGIDVTLRAGVEDPVRGVRLEPGPHRLDGPATVAVLEAAGPPLGELETLARVPPVLAGLLDAVAAEPALAGRLAALADGATPVLVTDAPDMVADVLVALAEARVDEDLAVLTLPVAPVGDGADVGFRLDEARAEPLLADRLGPWRPDPASSAGREVQILNGNGVPRIGQRVAELLADGGYRVVLTGNADRFTHETTRIILHADTPAQVAVGQDVQRRLGVGELELAATPSSVVDVTIVVGRDFSPPAPDGS